ncbi:MAG TPA: ATP-binding cassette domain-containing protein [Candidatus Aphodomonas merdavium]|nr:ATP-binding cassette domain-containing protein [Candidatus Aphodomonas merdavium]
MTKEVLLQVDNLKIYYPVKKTKIGEKQRYLHACDGVSFSVYKGETFGIVGESGCGKTTTGKALVKIVRPTSGTIRYGGKDIYKDFTRKEDFAFRRKLQMIFQDPFSSLDPRFTVGRIIGEPLNIHRVGTSAQRRERVIELMHEVDMRPEQMTKFPHEFSGGQRQRIGIARALALNPELIVCDEPVSALDVAIQAQVLNLMCDLQDKYGLTYIFVSHNLSVVKHICNRIAVMYLGQFVELAESEEMFRHPMHPYTVGLMEAIPVPDPDVPSLLAGLEGDVPTPIDPPAGCRFRSRCPKATEECGLAAPEFRELTPGHFVACHHAG